MIVPNQSSPKPPGEIPSKKKICMKRKQVRRPFVLMMILGLMLSAGLWDSFRSPDEQFLADIYVKWVILYQQWIQPKLTPAVQCRYIPTCSEYSIVAVKQHGIWKGLSLTLGRITSCTSDVKAGTCDPVPP